MTDIVLKDQLVVYDNDLQRIGWKPFNCKYLEFLFVSASVSIVNSKIVTKLSGEFGISEFWVAWFYEFSAYEVCFLVMWAQAPDPFWCPSEHFQQLKPVKELGM